jgi:hypothetical protein
MTESTAAQPAGPSCPWCSADLPSAAASACPSCGATLIGDTDAPLPGLTTIDPDAVARGLKPVTPERKSKLVSWITGDDEGGEEAPGTPESLAPPPPEVQREMLRMELEAEVANLQAEADALAAAAREENLIEDAQVLEAVGDEAAATLDDVEAAAPEAAVTAATTRASEDARTDPLPAAGGGVAPAIDPTARAADTLPPDRTTTEPGPTA